MAVSVDQPLGQTQTSDMQPSSPYAPGDWVENPDAPDWGRGQVQSAVGARVTVNFLHAGKRLVNTDIVALRLLRQPEE